MFLPKAHAMPGLAALVLILLGLSAGCGEPPPPPPDPDMVSLYVELAMAAGDAGAAAPDSTRIQIFRKYGTTAEAFEEALEVYREDPRGWVLFFRAVADSMDALVYRSYPTDRYYPPPDR